METRDLLRPCTQPLWGEISTLSILTTSPFLLLPTFWLAWPPRMFYTHPFKGPAWVEWTQARCLDQVEHPLLCLLRSKGTFLLLQAVNGWEKGLKDT